MLKTSYGYRAKTAQGDLGRPIAVLGDGGLIERRLLVIHGERPALDALTREFEEAGMRVVGALGAINGLHKLRTEDVAAVLVDFGALGNHPRSVVARLGEAAPLGVPVVLLGREGGEAEELLALQTGADDVVPAEASFRVLAARLSASVQRNADPLAQTGEQMPARVQAGPLVIDEARHVVTWQGATIGLTVTEFALLKCLAERPGYVRTRAQLMDKVYGENVHVEDRTVDSHIKRLRKKIRSIDPAFDSITTLYGVGYRFDRPPA